MKKRNITLWGLAFLGCLFGAQVIAQTTVNHPTAGNAGTFTISPAGTGFFNYFDPGGSAGNYGTSIFNSTVTFAPSAGANKVRCTFSSFATEAGFDFLSVYDGPTTGSPLIASTAGATPPTNMPGNIVQATLTNTSGQLTFDFFSDFSFVGAGWAAVVQELVLACNITAPANLNLSTGTANCTADAVSAAPTFSPAGCETSLTVRYRLNGGTPVIVPQPIGATVTIPGVPKGVNVVTWQLIDANGNVVGVATQTITVTDLVPPTITCPSNVTVNLDPGACDIIYSYNVGITDNCPFVTTAAPVQFPASFVNHGGGVAFTLQGNTLPGGVYFNLVNNSATALTVTGFGIRFGNPLFGVVNAPQTMQIFTAPTFVGNETNAGAWTNVGPAVVNPIPAYFATGTGALGQADITDVSIPAGQTRGFHIFGQNACPVFNFTFGVQPPVTNGPWTLAGGPTSFGLLSNLFQPGNNGIPNIQVNYQQVVDPTPVQTAGLPSGSTFPVGTTTNCFTATDVAGNTSTCCFNVTVAEYANPVTTLVCNDFVYVSLDETCTSVLNADQVLEGGPYGCYDDYVVQLDKTPPYGNGPWVAGVLGPQDIGKTYAVRVFDDLDGDGVMDATENNCWGNLKVEDKLAPTLDCPEASIFCNQDIAPCSLDPFFFPATPVQFPANFVNHGGGLAFTLQGNTLAGGVYFDITNTTAGTLTVNGFGIRFGNPQFGQVNPPQTMEIYSAPTFVGNETNAAAWTNVGPSVVTAIPPYFATGTGPLAQADLAIDVSIPAGQKRGFHIFGATACPVFDFTFGVQPPVTNGPWTLAGGPTSFGLLSNLFQPQNNAIPNIQVNYSALVEPPCLPNGLVLGTDAVPGTVPGTYVAFAGTGTPTLENCSDVTLSYIDAEVPQDCNTGLTKKVNRKWTAKDASGNTSTCVQVINVLRPSIDDVVFPPSYDNVNAPALACGGQYPTPDYIEGLGLQGYPEVFGSSDGCSIGWTSTDSKIDVCDGTYKIFREWKIIDWCTGDAVEVNQVIKVLDEQGPSISCPANLTVSTDPFSCCAVVNLPDVIISDNCSRINNIGGMVIGIDPFTLDTIGMFPIGGTLTTFPGNNLWNPDTLGQFGLTPCLPVGTHTVVYQAEDDCGNTSTCTFRLTVRDYIPPVAACTEFTVVSIGVDDPYDCYGPAGFLDVPPALGDCEGAGVTWVKAKTFDQGSYDNCNNVKFTVQRMAPYSDCINNLNQINGFLPCDDQFPDFPNEFERAVAEQDSIKFYCCEVGTSQMVILRVYQLDAFGNFAIGPDGTPIQNSCMVEVEVQDKIKPVCVSPGNVTVSCESFDPSLWAYGKPTVFDNCCLDTAYNYQDQCGLQHTVSYNLFDTVCNRGTINRTFRVYDCHGQSSQCTQRIIVTYEQDYWIKFPNDVVVTVCDGTGNYGEPVFNGDQDCELLGVSFEDEIFTVVPDACFKIERTWTIINWCTYNVNGTCIVVPNPNPNATVNHPTNLAGPIVSPCGTPAPWAPTNVAIAPGQPQTNFCTFWDANANCYKYKQIIKVVDLQDPTVSNCPASPVEYCDFSVNDPLLWNQMYWWDGVSHDLCEGDAPLTITATDACSGANINITYLLFLDLDGDGTMETVINSNNTPAPGTVNYNNLGNPSYAGGTPQVFDGRPVLPNEIYRWANHQSVSGTSRTASVQWKTFAQMPTPANQLGTAGIAPQLPYGTHKIKWTITDGCGNESFCEYTFVVKDCKAPTVVCFDGLSVNIMPAGMVDIWASDFLQYGDDNCTPANLLKYSIRKAGQGTGFPVDAFGDPIPGVTFDCTELGPQEIELWAMDLAGNAAFCQATIDVQDPFNNCIIGNKVDVAGALKTEANEGVEDANVNLQSGATSLFDMTDQDGAFSFANAVDMNANYTVTPTKDDNPLNGVSTYDLVLISKHILGLEPLSTPYKMIAADANKSNSITTFDIVEIRKLILGIYTELPNNTSWRFVDKSFSFPNQANPFQSQFPETKSVVGVTADQLADDFMAVKVGDVNGTAIPNALLSSDDRTAGTMLFDVEDRAVKAGETFTLTFKGAERVQGYQFTMNFAGLEVLNVTPGAGMSTENFGVFADALTTSVDGEGNEFAVTFRAAKAGLVSEMLGVSSRVTRAEAYSLANNRMDVAFRFNGQGGAVISGVGFELYQNQPNPFVNKTVIGFHLPEAAEATLSVYDESGRMLFTQKGQFIKGYNAISVDRALLNTTGLMYYKLETATDAATKKMIQTK